MRRKPRVLTRRMQVKLMVTFFLLIISFIGLVSRLTYINATSGKQYEQKVLSQQNYSSITIPYKRGEIKDRNGATLATSVKVYNLILEPKNIIQADKKSPADKAHQYQNMTVEVLTTYFDVTAQEINQAIQDKPDSYYIKLRKKVSYDVVKPYLDFMNDKKNKEKSKLVIGVNLEAEYQRSYPNNSLASTLVGYTSSGNAGIWGIENQYNSILNGTDGREYGYISEGENLERTVISPTNGNSVVSTIDSNLQRIVEKHIRKFVKGVGVKKSVNVLVTDPNNGEVLAMATDNSYDLNDPFNEKLLLNKYSKKEITAMSDKDKAKAINAFWRNPIISDSFEPGSTFKPITVAMALEENKVKPGSTFNCTGHNSVADRDIKCRDGNGHGILNLAEAIQNSCNSAMIQISRKTGIPDFSRYQQIFGFGQKTGIDLPGEFYSAAALHQADSMTAIDIATNSFGQNFNATMIQMSAAFASVINGGYYYQPRVVKQVLNENGGVVQDFDKVLVRNTVSKKTCEFLKKSLKLVVEKGTAKGAKIKGYSIGGKTGTAEKIENGKRLKKNYVVSFMGFAPVEKPQFVIYVVIDEPNVDQQVSSYAVDLGNDIMKEMVAYMNTPKIEK